MQAVSTALATKARTNMVARIRILLKPLKNLSTPDTPFGEGRQTLKSDDAPNLPPQRHRENVTSKARLFRYPGMAGSVVPVRIGHG